MYKNIGIIDNFKNCISKNYFKLSGRASRQEYWKFVLVILILPAILNFISELFFYLNMEKIGLTMTWIELFFEIFTFIPLITATVRRLHDSNKPGYLILLPLMVILIMVALEYIHYGLITLQIFYIFLIVYTLIFIFLIICTLLKGNVGANKYGADPYEE